jgi:hypothetical protein
MTSLFYYVSNIYTFQISGYFNMKMISNDSLKYSAIYFFNFSLL